MKFIITTILLGLVSCASYQNLNNRNIANTSNDFDSIKCTLSGSVLEHERTVFIRNNYEAGVRFPKQDITIFFQLVNNNDLRKIKIRYYEGAWAGNRKGKPELYNYVDFVSKEQVNVMDAFNANLYLSKCEYN